MKRFHALAVLSFALLPACASLPLGSGGGRDDLWVQAQRALLAGSFRTADSAFSRLATEHVGTTEGREAVFFLGAIRIDPRNPGFTSRGASDYLRRYLASPDSGRNGKDLYRKPEAQTLLSLAEQLNLAPAERIASLQGDQSVRTVTVPGPTRTVTTEGSQVEVERLRGEVRERDETIRELREELTRIRNTLAPPSRRP
ncbi:MAG TPA: hypothetical protein VF263_07470 [Longimicrobiaceae bacterium]